MQNIERKIEELCIATQNPKDSQIKGELQLVAMNETIQFISDKFDEFEKDRREKDDIIKNLTKETSDMAKRISDLESVIDRQEQYSRRNCLLIHKVAETKGENTDQICIDLINEKLDINLTEKDIDRSHRIGMKKDDNNKSRPIILKLVRYNTRKRIFLNKKRLKGTGVSITESLTVRKMDELKNARVEHGFENVWTVDGKIFFKQKNENKSSLYYN